MVTINDVIDYIYGQYPYYDFIAKHLIEVGYWLIVSLSYRIFYFKITKVVES